MEDRVSIHFSVEDGIIEVEQKKGPLISRKEISRDQLLNCFRIRRFIQRQIRTETGVPYDHADGLLSLPDSEGIQWQKPGRQDGRCVFPDIDAFPEAI